MKEEWKDKWVKALRSGEYKQGRERLRSGNQFCCLGVLADLVIKENPDTFCMESWDEDNVVIDKVNSDDNRQRTIGTGLLTDPVIDIVGMRSLEGSFKFKNNLETCLWHQNDKRRKSFKKIADIIDEYWEVL
jgi:hypothetical protein